MTVQTPATVEIDALLRGYLAMGVMTRRATHLLVALAAAVALAVVHLLELRDSFHPRFVGMDKRRQDGFERQPWPEVVQVPSTPHDARLPLEMTLLADGLAQRIVQLGRIHDRRIKTLGQQSPFLDMLLPRSVAAFAADGVTRCDGCSYRLR